MARYQPAETSPWSMLANILSQFKPSHLIVWFLYLQAQFFGLLVARAQKVIEIGQLPYPFNPFSNNPTPLSDGRYGRCLSLNQQALSGMSFDRRWDHSAASLSDAFTVQIQPETVVCFTANKPSSKRSYAQEDVVLRWCEQQLPPRKTDAPQDINIIGFFRRTVQLSRDPEERTKRMAAAIQFGITDLWEDSMGFWARSMSAVRCRHKVRNKNIARQTEMEIEVTTPRDPLLEPLDTFVITNFAAKGS